MDASIEFYEAHFYFETIESNGMIRVKQGTEKIPAHISKGLIKEGIFTGDDHDTSIPEIMSRISAMRFDIVDDQSALYTRPGVFKENFLEIKRGYKNGSRIYTSEVFEVISDKDQEVARRILSQKPVIAYGWYQIPGKNYKTVQKVTFEKRISQRQRQQIDNPFEIIIGDSIPNEFLEIEVLPNGYLDLSVLGYGVIVEDGVTGRISYKLATECSPENISKTTQDIKLSPKEIKKAFHKKKACFICRLIEFFKKKKK